jgi:hypothetical protein
MRLHKNKDFCDDISSDVFSFLPLLMYKYYYTKFSVSFYLTRTVSFHFALCPVLIMAGASDILISFFSMLSSASPK